MVLTFVEYKIPDDGVILHFVADDPGPGLANDYYVTITDAELSTVTTTAQFRTLAASKLARKVKAQGYSKLDGMVGQSVTI